MSNKKPNKRHSAPGAAAGSASMMPWGPMYYPWSQPMPMPGSSAFSQQPKPSPWDTDSDSDEDFQPKKKYKPLLKPSPSQAVNKGKKRGPGRPSKKELEEQAKMNDYLSTVPKTLEETKDVIAVHQKDECRACRIYKGNLAFKSCGHGLYCRKCVNKKRLEWINLKRPAKCYEDDCYSLVSGWLQLTNVNI